MGHVRRERGAGYSTLPMPQSGHHTLPHQSSSGSPQIGMVHPIPQHPQSTPPMSTSPAAASMANASDINMPRKYPRHFKKLHHFRSSNCIVNL